jgi:hypothetical protein
MLTHSVDIMPTEISINTSMQLLLQQAHGSKRKSLTEGDATPDDDIVIM